MNESLFKQHYMKSVAFIQQGLSSDEAGNVEQALQQYTLALQVMSSCLNTAVHPQRDDLPWISKIKKNRDMITPRVAELMKLQEQKFVSPPIPLPKQQQSSSGLLSGVLSWFGGSSEPTPQSQPQQNSQPTRTNTPKPTVQQYQQPQQQVSRLDQMQRPLHRTSNNPVTAASDVINNSPRSRMNQDIHIARPPVQAVVAPTKPAVASSSSRGVNQNRGKVPLDQIKELKGVDKKLLDHILNEVVQTDQAVKWEDIAGLADAKQVLHETIILPSLRPDLFQGLRAPAKGVLLFGPPGNGKTLLAKVVSSQCKSTFFSISASTLVSKWHGEGEKMVKALFAAANYLAPSVIFIDEIDSILTSRSSNEHEASRRMKTEFLVQIDGVTANLNQDNRVLVMGATNRPFELDTAILRRFTKRIYIPLPDSAARLALIKNALGSQRTKLSQYELDRIAKMTDGFSGSDLKALCQDASMVAIREMGSQQILTIRAEELRPISMNDFAMSLKRVRPSVSHEAIQELMQWNKEFGTVTL